MREIKVNLTRSAPAQRARRPFKGCSTHSHSPTVFVGRDHFKILHRAQIAAMTDTLGHRQIERDGKIVEQLGPRGIFGEMTLIDGAPCAATATTKTACEVAPITEKASLFLVHETPFFAISVMRDLGDR